MNLFLKRTRKDLYGIFGELEDVSGKLIAVTLEHAWPTNEGEFIPTIPEGVFTCVRGIHKLSNLNPFETFEITGVRGHSGLLFHKGNYQTDSTGCVLLGLEIGVGCILESAKAFNQFMELQGGCDSFVLEVLNSNMSIMP